MAKISARGDTAQFRWQRTRVSHNAAPWQMLLTAQGRLLYKRFQGDGWTLRRRGCTESQAFAQAATFGMKVAP